MLCSKLHSFYLEIFFHPENIQRNLFTKQHFRLDRSLWSEVQLWLELDTITMKLIEILLYRAQYNRSPI
jgi:hypothetical protein